jgi:hypothetical protein
VLPRSHLHALVYHSMRKPGSLATILKPFHNLNRGASRTSTPNLIPQCQHRHSDSDAISAGESAQSLDEKWATDDRLGVEGFLFWRALLLLSLMWLGRTFL